MGCVSSKSKDKQSSKKYESNQTAATKEQLPSQPAVLADKTNTTQADPLKTQKDQSKQTEQKPGQKTDALEAQQQQQTKNNTEGTQKQQQQQQQQQQEQISKPQPQQVSDKQQDLAAGKLQQQPDQKKEITQVKPADDQFNNKPISNGQISSLPNNNTVSNNQGPVDAQGQLKKAQTTETPTAGNSVLKNNNNNEIPLSIPAVDPTSLKGLTQSLAGQQMRISKGGKQPQQFSLQENNSKIGNNNNNILSNQEDQDFSQDYQEEPEANMGMYAVIRQTTTKPQARDYIVNKHMLCILESLKTQDSVGKTCYSTPPVPLLDSAVGGEWVQIETFGVFGQNEQKQQDNFMYD